ncbi:MAG: 3'-5' exoribonuclease YhaM [Phycisphaerae bacterium]|nr:3'-5' exoribonuclease YhaM [Phycisphaerae bacterium]
MTHRYINDMGPGETVINQVFMIASKDLRTTSNGSLYIHTVLADKTGQIPARMWQATESHYKLLPEGGFVQLRGRTESYKGHLQFIIEGINVINEKDVNVADFLPTTERNIPEMWTKVRTIMESIKDHDLLALVKCFIDDPQLAANFQRSPAAITMHHAYVGGLLEHTLNLLELAQLVIPRYPELSLDLVLAGLFLHDIGKTQELKYDTNFSYSDQGQLVGHIVMSVMWIEEKVRQAEKITGRKFPDEKKWALQHLVLSHHGQYEYGSPKLPATPEAIAVHYLDNLDAKLQQALKIIAADNDEESNWTAYLPALETKLYKRDVVPDGN